MGLQGKVWVMTNPWNGVLTATATPFKADLSIDYDKYAEHVAWLAANGTHGVIPNGSLGEYQVLTAEERAKMVEAAVAAGQSECFLRPLARQPVHRHHGSIDIHQFGLLRYKMRRPVRETACKTGPSSDYLQARHQRSTSR